MPQSVEFMESKGFIVREITELKAFDQTLMKALDEYVYYDKVGAAADFVRQAIIYEEGGFYMDLDFYLTKWDIKINQIFDFFGFKCGEYDSYVLFTWGFLAKAGHPI